MAEREALGLPIDKPKQVCQSVNLNLCSEPFLSSMTCRKIRRKQKNLLRSKPRLYSVNGIPHSFYFRKRGKHYVSIDASVDYALDSYYHSYQMLSVKKLYIKHHTPLTPYMDRMSHFRQLGIAFSSEHDPTNDISRIYGVIFFKKL